MKTLICLSAFAVLLLVTAPQADARWGGGWQSQTSFNRVGPGEWTRSGSITGPRGNTDTFAGTSSCGGGSCSRATTFTGPNGRTVTGDKTVTRTAPGQFSSSGSVTGPNGGTISHSGTTACADGFCSHTGTFVRQ